MSDASTITLYWYDGHQVIEETNSSGTLQREFVYGEGIDEVVRMRLSGGSAYYYHTNSIGSVVAISDSAGSVVERYDYDAFGKAKILAPDGTTERTTSAFGNPYMFQGRRWDGESGLYHYRARAYSSEMGRFLQRDGLGYVDSMNLYEGLANAPMNWVDPWGNRATALRLEESWIFRIVEAPTKAPWWNAPYAYPGSNWKWSEIISIASVAQRYKWEAWKEKGLYVQPYTDSYEYSPSGICESPYPFTTPDMVDILTAVILQANNKPAKPEKPFLGVPPLGVLVGQPRTTTGNPASLTANLPTINLFGNLDPAVCLNEEKEKKREREGEIQVIISGHVRIAFSNDIEFVAAHLTQKGMGIFARIEDIPAEKWIEQLDTAKRSIQQGKTLFSVYTLKVPASQISSTMKRVRLDILIYHPRYSLLGPPFGNNCVTYAANILSSAGIQGLTFVRTPDGLKQALEKAGFIRWGGK